MQIDNRRVGILVSLLAGGVVLPIVLGWLFGIFGRVPFWVVQKTGTDVSDAVAGFAAMVGVISGIGIDVAIGTWVSDHWSNYNPFLKERK